MTEAGPAATRAFDLWGAPFDGGATLGWPGSRYAPDRVRAALKWITMRIEGGEIYNLETDRIIRVGDGLLTDRGDVHVVGHDLTATIDATTASVRDSAAAGRVPIVVGGDDSLLFPVARGLHEAVTGRVGIVHFDAHLDLMDSNEYQGRFSHSSGMRRSLELDRITTADCVQIGSRHFNFPVSGAYKHRTGLRHISAHDYLSLGTDTVVERVLDHVSGADHLFLSFDIDTVDPAFAPGAGAHEPGGITSDDALQAVRLLAPHCSAMAITEVNPMKDVGDMTSTLAAYLAVNFAVFGVRPAT